MSTTETNPRVRVERNVYRRFNAAGQKIFEIGWRDSEGRWCRRITGPKISVARHHLRQELAKRGRNEPAPVNPKLSFGEAMDGYLAERMAHLRESTKAGHRWAVKTWLRPRFGNRRLDRISASDWSAFVADMREQGKSDGTIASALKTAKATYRYAERFKDWSGRNTLALLDASEKPIASVSTKRRLFSDAELDATLAAATGQNRILFAFLAATGCRISEALGLTWTDLDLADLDAAEVHFRFQADAMGERQPLKTDSAERTIELGRVLAGLLAEHKAGSQRSKRGDFVFASRSGSALDRHNVARELRRAEKAAKLPSGKPAFPILSDLDAEGQPVKVSRGAIPSLHGFRHSYASAAISEGDGVEETSWALGHANSNVTRAVYVTEIKTVERAIKRRARSDARYGDRLAKLGSAHGSTRANPKRSPRTPKSAPVVSLEARRKRAN